MPVITIERESTYADSMRSYAVFVDGSRVGSVRAGEECGVTVTPGSHEVVLRLGWIWRSRSLIVEVPADGEVRVGCRSAAGVNNVLAMFKPRSYIELSQV